MRLSLAFIFTLSFAVPRLHADAPAGGQMDQSSFAGTAQGDARDYNGPSKAEKSRVKSMIDALLLDGATGSEKTPSADSDSSTAN